MPVVYLGLGSNLGDRQQNLEQAVAALDQEPGVRVRRVSSFHVTAPYGVEDQPEFLNGEAHEHEHDNGIASVSLTATKPLDGDRLTAWLRAPPPTG